MAPPPVEARQDRTDTQRSFDELGTPLYDVTFCVVDLETTGGSPKGDAITEIGAVRLRGGECLGTFQTLVNPGCPIPPSITVLTGITEAMVFPAPPLDEVLPALMEFIGDAVIVGHNVRFDVGFLDAALTARGRPPLTNRRVDTCALARRLVRDEVRDCKLGTLARHFRLRTEPTHRALDDALATGELLHCLLERAATFGVTGLVDLVDLPRMAGHPQGAKLRLTRDLPPRPGVYLFRDRGGRPLYVGKATDLRARVRSYFSSDDRRKVGQLLREAHQIDHRECATSLEAAVVELRWMHALRPRFNRVARDPERYRYVRLTVGEPFPRLSVVRTPDPAKGLHLGPVSSTARARAVVEAIESAVPLRRCTQRLGRLPTRAQPCTAAQLGASLCPCADPAGVASAYAAAVEAAMAGFGGAHEVFLEPLRRRMATLAGAERFEEAADVRDRAAAVAAVLRRSRQLTSLRASGELVVEDPGAGGARLIGGVLRESWGPDGQTRLLDPDPPGSAADPSPHHVADGDALLLTTDDSQWVAGTHEVDELVAVARWLEDRAARIRIVACSGTFALPRTPVPTFAIERSAGRLRG
ncbi:MAG: DEDD exonuclease domain-containing protein [Acidimicrobiia bacterium]|nr:DEDD exonuclease domain-containing protein [Acidimicrobiia bacterium]